MNFSQELGLKIKRIRLNEKMTLAECSEVTGLSVGFLSQIENGKTSISIDNLQSLAKCLDVELNYFFDSDEKKQNIVISKKCNRRSKALSETISAAVLSDSEKDMNILPSIITIEPEMKWDGNLKRHEGDVLFYVLDGILSLRIGEEDKRLFPGDAAHFLGQSGYAYWNESPFVTHIFFAKKKL